MHQQAFTRLLHQLGIIPRYTGYRFLLFAITLIQSDPSVLNHVVRDIYMPIARHFHADWRNVEHNLRTLTHRTWYVDKDLVSHICGYSLSASPTVSELLESLAYFSRYPENQPDLCAGSSLLSAEYRLSKR